MQHTANYSSRFHPEYPQSVETSAQSSVTSDFNLVGDVGIRFLLHVLLELELKLEDDFLKNKDNPEETKVSQKSVVGC